VRSYMVVKGFQNGFLCIAVWLRGCGWLLGCCYVVVKGFQSGFTALLFSCYSVVGGC